MCDLVSLTSLNARRCLLRSDAHQRLWLKRIEPVGKGQSDERRVLSRTEERRLNRVKIPSFIVGLFLTLSTTSQAGPHGGGFRSGGFHGGFVVRSAGRTAPNGGRFNGGDFHRGFVAHNAGSAFSMGHSIHRDFANRRFFCHGRLIVFQQFAWPVCSYPYYDPSAYSYQEPYPDYQYWDNSGASVQPESFRRGVDNGPIVVVINTGNSRPMDSSSNGGYVDSGSISTSAVGNKE